MSFQYRSEKYSSATDLSRYRRRARVSPIAESTLRSLAAKCANAHVIKRRAAELQPIQVSVCVSGGVEAAIHSMLRLVSDIPDDHVLVNLDFSNAYNAIGRDTVLKPVADKIPELYRFIHASLA